MSNFKRILALAITMLMVVGCFASFASVSAFEDVEKYEDEINALYKLGIIEGKDAEGTTFAPDENVTRWQMALLIAKMMTGKVNDAYVNWYSTENFTPFTDVNKDQFYGSMSYAHNMGVIIGTTPTTFNPNGEITYQDALTMVVRALGYGSAEMDAGYPWTFVNKAIELGIDADFEETLNYGTPLTRGQVAKLLYNTLFTQRYNDYTTFNQETDTYRYTTFAQDVFGYMDASLTAVIVAAEDFYLNPTLEASLGININYDNYNVIVPEKRASYVGFVLFEDIMDAQGAWVDVLVLPASEFGLDAPDRLQIGTTYAVAIDNQGDGIVSRFERCNKVGEYKLAESFAFSNNPAINANAAIATNVTIDGNSYILTDDPTMTTDLLTDGTPNASSEIHYIMVIRRNDNSIVYGVPAVNTVEQDLLCIDLDGNGYYDLAYQINYVFGRLAGARAEGGIYNDGGYAITLCKPYSGETLEPLSNAAVAAGYYYYEFTDTWAGGANWYDPDNGSGIFFVKKGVGIKATGVVTGVDLYNKTVTLDGVNVDNPGTTYKVAGASETDTHTAGLAFDKDLMGHRVSLYANDTTGEIVLFIEAPLAGAVAQTMFAIFVEDTGRRIKNDYPLIAVYDVTGSLTYVTAKQKEAAFNALNLQKGDMLELTLDEKTGYYTFAALPAEYNDGRALRQDASTLEQVVEWSNAVVDGAMTVWHYMPIIADTYYLDFQNATVLGFNGTSFKQYNGKDLGDGTTIVPDDGSAVRIYIKRQIALPNNEFDLVFLYVQGDINATAAVSYSKALSSIVYVAGDPNSHAYSNYDMIGTMPTGVGDITYYNAVDMVSGEFRAVKTSGVYGYVVPAGFYFVDKDGNLGGDASAEMEIGTQLCMNAHAAMSRETGFQKYGATVKKVNITADYQVLDTTATIMAAGAGGMQLVNAFWEAAWTTNDGNIAIYKGTAYASDVVVGIVIDGGVSPF